MQHPSLFRLLSSILLAVSLVLSVSCSSDSETTGDGDGDSPSSGGMSSSGGSMATQTGGTTGGDGDTASGGTGDGDGDGDGSRPSQGPPPVVTLHSECGQQGASAALTVGDYDAAALEAEGLAPGSIPSIQITSGYKAILYTNAGFLGDTTTLTSSDSCLSGFAIASLRIREDLGGQATSNPGTGGDTGDPGPPPCDSTTGQEETCEAFGVLLAGRYWVNNNLWGQDAGTGQQCVRRTCTDGDAISWETDWSWSNAPSSVKSYSSAVLGWHWGYHVEDTGLPVQASDSTNVNCDWTYSVSQNGTMNVAYDMWLHSVPAPQWGRQDFPTDEPTDELMIWLYRAGGAGPIGSTVGPPVSIAGATWDLHEGQIIGDGGQPLWNVHSFVRTENTSSASLNVKDFIDEVVARGLMPSSRYLTSIQAGPEVFVGDGSLSTTSFSCTIQ